MANNKKEPRGSKLEFIVKPDDKEPQIDTNGDKKNRKKKKKSKDLNTSTHSNGDGSDLLMGTSLHHQKKKKSCRACCCFCYSMLFFILFIGILYPVKETFDPDARVVDEVISQLNEALPFEVLANVDRPGTILAKQGLKAHFPVVLLPGIVSTGLEVWKGKPCAQKHFRERFWGTSLMVQKILLSRKCWKEHICLNHTTWQDPEGIKLRPANGLGAADYFLGDYWVWAKMIENLADVGYDESNMFMASYDWRLTYQYLEERDHYFTRLKSTIELLSTTNGNRKVVIVSHSMGGIVMHYFNKWAESEKGGKGGPNWVNDHIEAEVNIGGPLLGVPKAISSVLSGEMRDTAELNTFLFFVKENLLSKNDIAEIFRSFGSIPSMIPKGGNIIWGDAEHGAPENPDFQYLLKFPTPEEKKNLHEPVSPLQGATIQGLSSCPNEDTPLDKVIEPEKAEKITKQSYPVEGALDVLREVAPNYMKQVDTFYSFETSRNLSDPKFDDPRYWTNPLQSALPNAPHTKLYCLYGVGKETERLYYYHRNSEKCSNLPFLIDTKINNGTKLNYGVQLAEGDGTVPLMSLGFMCVKGWKDPVYNPNNMRVITREYRHEAETILTAKDNVLRGGVTTADHIDIMGNHILLEDVIRIATNDATFVEDRLISNIVEYSNNVDFNLAEIPPKVSTKK